MELSIALYLVIFRFAAGNHIHATQNVAAVTGNPVNMSCGTYALALYRLLYFRGVNESKEILLFNGQEGSSRSIITKDDIGIYRIRLENVTASDAGIYRCVVRVSKSGVVRTVEEFKSDLIVIDSTPFCNTNASSVDYQGQVGEILLLYCTVDYIGNWSPYVEWSRNDGINISKMSTVIQTHNSMTSTLTIRLNPVDNYVTYACKTYLSSEIGEKNQVRNVLGYPFIWIFTANVLFGPQQIEIKPRHESYSPNDNLYCNASGNPNPFCKWIDLDTEKVVAKECLFSIDESMIRDQMYNLQCIAENAIVGVKNNKATNITFWVVDQKDTWPLPQYSIIGIAVAIAAGGILLSVIVTTTRKFMKRKCCDNTGKESSAEAPSSRHDYESISDTDIQMNKMEMVSVTTIENKEEEVQNEDRIQEVEQEVQLNVDTHSTSANDVATDLAQTVTGGDYSSLKARQITQRQPDVYSQLAAMAAGETAASVSEERSDMIPSVSYSYYNLH